MKDEDIPPLPDDLQALLKASPRPSPPEGFEAKVLARIKQSVPPSGGGGGSPAPGSAGQLAGAGARMGSWGIPVSVAALVVGLAGGMLLGRQLAPKPEAVVVAPTKQEVQPVVVAPPLPEREPEVNPPPVEEKPPVLAINKPKATKAPTRESAVDAGVAARDIALSEERGLIEVARTSLARRDSARALQAISEHANRFPSGQLAEEREVLWVQALAASGDLAGARKKAAEFQRRFPESMLQPAVDAALTPNP